MMAVENENTCYSGQNIQQWQNAVTTINDSHVNLFPKLLEKGIQGNWKKVNPNYPKIEGIDKNSVTSCIEAYKFVNQENGNIDQEKAENDEKKALDHYKITKDFVKIIDMRDKLLKVYGKLTDEIEEIQIHQFDNSVQIILIEHQTGDEKLKNETKQKIMDRVKAYINLKSKIEKTLKMFKSSSKNLAEQEGSNFDEKFNKNEYLNYFQFTKNFLIDDKSIMEYFREQEVKWSDPLMYLRSQSSGEVKPMMSEIQNPKGKESDIGKFEQKMKVFKNFCEKAEIALSENNVEDLKTHIKRIQKTQEDLYDLQFSSDIKMSKDDEMTMEKSEKLTRNINIRIEDILSKRTAESESRKQEIASNLRTMQSIKLLNLTGPEDFISWKKNQKCLNTHTDPYKKGAALLATLKDPLDLQMCKNIYDFETLMTKLNAKYNHEDKIITALKKQLEKLPMANSNQILLKNIRLILNVYQQLLDIKAEGHFDSTVVNYLKMKFSETVRLEYEKFVKSKLNQTHINNIDEHGNIVSKTSGKSTSNMDLEIPNNSAEIRKLFLAFIRDQADNLEKAGVSQETSNAEAKPKCQKCKQNLKYCKCEKTHPRVKASIYNLEVKNACICCGSKEPHKTKFGKNTLSLGRCPKFQNMTQEAKRDFANKNRACYVCLVPGHSQKECRIESLCPKCEKGRHHISLCKDFGHSKTVKGEVNACESHLEIEEYQSNSVLREVTQCKILFKDPQNGQDKFKTINVLWDSGATVNVIEDNLPRELGYTGKMSRLELQTVTSISPRQKSYMVYIMDRYGKVHPIKAYGHPENNMPKPSIPLKNKAMKRYAELFNVRRSQISNVAGPIDLILGNITLRHLYPKLKTWKKEELLSDTQTSKYLYDKSEGLGLFRTVFGDKPYFLSGLVALQEFAQPDNPNWVSVHHMDVYTNNYWTGDQLGLNLDPKCSTCIKAPPCKQCKLMNQPLSFKEQEEGKIIKNSMTFDLDKKEVHVSYPYMKNINEIFKPEKSNRFVAEKMAHNLVKSLNRDNLLKPYTKDFMDMERRGAIRELSEQEMKEWESQGNPINYCSHHPVMKDSKSTPCRSVCNSSLSHNNTTLNALLPKGPTALSNLLHVLLRFREKPYVVICDLSKAYNTIKTSLKDCHLRRLLWYREEDLENPNPKLRTFGMLSMAFGDTPAQYYLECAKEEVCNYTRNVMKDEKLADDILAKSYVDDVAISLETLKEAKTYKEKLPEAFGSYGFKIKEIFVGGTNVKQKEELEKQKLFGHIYDPNEDEIILKFVVNFSSKKRSKKTEPNLTSKSDITNLIMTKRKFMSLLSSQYDPIGLASVFLAKYKIFQARLFKNPEYDWDVKLSDDDQKHAITLVKQIIYASENSPTFKRSNKPEGYKLSKLIVFVDASTVSLQVVVYGLYTSNKTQNTHTSLITAKNRVSHFTVPRNELQSLVAGHRLVLNFLEAHDEPVKEVCFLSDSTCTLDSLKESFISKDIFVINRISEIRKAAQKMNCDVKYYHIESKLNVADKGTREDCKFEYLSSEEWQHGPEFLKDLDSAATYRLDIKKSSIQREVNMLHTKEIRIDDCVWSNLLERSNNLKTLLRVYCHIKSMFQNKSFRSQKALTNQKINEAFLFFVKMTQEKMKLEKMRTKQLVTFEENGIIYTKMRYTSEMMMNIFEKDKLPVIPGKSKLAKLVISNAHSENICTNLNKVHNSIHQTLVNSRIGLYGCYITYAKQNIKGIVRNCTNCRRLKKIPANAKMAERKGGFGEIPPDGSAFNKIAMDYFGPFFCKPPRGRETRGTKFYKMYGMAVLCQQTRAVKFYPVEGYDTESFLNTFKIHCSMHGVPTHVLSDPMTTFISGSKLVGADPEPAETSNSEFEKSDFENILEREYNIEWDFIPPGSQWRDPAERSIKSLKEMMQTIFNSEHNKKVLTLNEYWCIFSECAEILNRRPIQGFIDNDTLSFICPNQLILGRTSKYQPIAKSEILETKPRLQLIENIKSEFWNNMMNVLAADTKLMKYPCWYSQSREPKVGDIVLILYKTKITDNYRIGKIETVNENKRDITCKVSPVQDGSLTNFKSTAIMNIPVQRTILLYSEDDKSLD